jgi:hypothetical protein
MTSPLSYWTWSPDIHLPWSGEVRQQIKPDATWFSNWITPANGNATVEERAFTKVASYGTQLGLITDVLLALVDQAKLTAEKESVTELQRIKKTIGDLKAMEHGLDNDLIAAQVREVQKRGGEQLRQLQTLLTPLLKETPLTLSEQQPQTPG